MTKDRGATTPDGMDPGEIGRPEPGRSIAIFSVLASIVIVVLDSSIVNVALPTIAGSMQVSPALSVWIVTAYQMALVMALLPCAALGASLGYRRVFTAGVMVFLAGSLSCALAPTLWWLLASRFIQGLGGAAVMSLGVALMRLVVLNRQLGAVIGWNALAVALSSAAGPTIGATIISGLSWPWLFAVNIPLGLLVIAGSRALPDDKGTLVPFDHISALLNAVVFASLILGVQSALEQPLLAMGLLALSATALLILIPRERPKIAPLIPLDLLRSRSFRISVIASVMCFTGQTAGMVALPFYLQHSFGLNALTTGLYLTAWPLTVAIAAPLSGRLANYLSSGTLCAAGGTILASGLIGAAVLPLTVNSLPLLPMCMLSGFGFGLFQVANNRNMFLAAPRERSSAAGGLQSTARLAGQTTGAVLMTLFFTAISLELAPRVGLAVGGALALLAGVISTLRIAQTR